MSTTSDKPKIFLKTVKLNISLYSNILNSFHINVYDFILGKQKKNAKKIYLYIFINLCFKCSLQKANIKRKIN